MIWRKRRGRWSCRRSPPLSDDPLNSENQIEIVLTDMILRLKRISPDLPAEHARVLLLVSFDLELYLGGGQLGLAPPQHPGSYAACLLVPGDNNKGQGVSFVNVCPGKCKSFQRFNVVELGDNAV